MTRAFMTRISCGILNTPACFFSNSNCFLNRFSQKSLGFPSPILRVIELQRNRTLIIYFLKGLKGFDKRQNSIAWQDPNFILMFGMGLDPFRTVRKLKNSNKIPPEVMEVLEFGFPEKHVKSIRDYLGLIVICTKSNLSCFGNCG